MRRLVLSLASLFGKSKAIIQDTHDQALGSTSLVPGRRERARELALVSLVWSGTGASAAVGGEGKS